MKDFNFLGLVEEVREKERVEEENEKVKKQKKREKELLRREKYKDKKNALQKFKNSLTEKILLTKDEIISLWKDQELELKSIGFNNDILKNNLMKLKDRYDIPETYINKKYTNESTLIFTCDCCNILFNKTKREYNQILPQAKTIFCNKICFRKFHSSKMVTLICNFCNIKYEITQNNYNKKIKAGTKFNFCSLKCNGNSKYCRVILNCNYCNKEFNKFPSDVIEKNYCSRKCVHSAFALIKRSQLEIYLENQIKQFFPDIKFIPSDREICEGLELDFYFKDLNIAIEINGIHHRENIFGQLEERKFNDRLKNKICKEREVKLYTISIFDKFNDKGAKENHWKTIKNILMSYIPYCENKENCISELYNPESKILNGLILNYGVRSKFLKNPLNKDFIIKYPEIATEYHDD